MELKELLEQLQKAFAEFRRANDERLKQLETRGVADPTTVDTVEKLNARMTELEKQIKAKEGELARLEALEKLANRPGGVSGDSEKDHIIEEHRKAFGQFMRRGEERGLGELQEKALNITTGSDGGYAVPEVIDRAILSLVAEVSPMRQIVNVQTVSTSDYKKLVNTRGTTVGWVGEATARTATDASSLQEVTPFMGEIYALPFATQQMLDDVFFDAEAWVEDEVATAIAQAEGAAVIDGSGTNRPKGINQYTFATTGDSSRTFGQLQKVQTGVAGGFKTASKTVSENDDLIDLIYSLKSQHRQGARFVMNSLTTAAVRKWKDQEGRPVWQPQAVAGQPALLNGFPVTNAEDMPDIANEAIPIWFGNFKRGYTLVDRIGTRILRDPFTNKPYVGFYITKRVGGFVADSEAIKGLATEAAGS